MDLRQTYVDALLRYGEKDARVWQTLAADYATKCAAELELSEARGDVVGIEMNAAETLLFLLRMAERHRLPSLRATLTDFLKLQTILDCLNELRADVDEMAAILAEKQR